MFIQRARLHRALLACLLAPSSPCALPEGLSSGNGSDITEYYASLRAITGDINLKVLLYNSTAHRKAKTQIPGEINQEHWAKKCHSGFHFQTNYRKKRNAFLNRSQNVLHDFVSFFFFTLYFDVGLLQNWDFGFSVNV